MHKLYKPTLWDRTTVTQEIREILPPESRAPQGSVRRVQLVVPPSPVVYAKIDGDPVAIGLNRSYKLPVASPNATIEFTLQPHQNIVAAAKVGFAEISIIVEYVEP